jgi:isoquinoline 1-oxidoreductase alpha subunit
MSVKITVNGEDHTLDIDPNTPLLWVLRDELRLTGTKYGCGIAQCGACTVHVNGSPRRACVTPLSSLQGQNVTTIEGIAGPEADAIKASWAEHDTPQCGYCQSGQVMSAVALLRNTPAPDRAQIDAAMKGNLCRCATYIRIRQAINTASKKLEA